MKGKFLNRTYKEEKTSPLSMMMDRSIWSKTIGPNQWETMVKIVDEAQALIWMWYIELKDRKSSIKKIILYLRFEVANWICRETMDVINLMWLAVTSYPKDKKATDTTSRTSHLKCRRDMSSLLCIKFMEWGRKIYSPVVRKITFIQIKIIFATTDMSELVV